MRLLIVTAVDREAAAIGALDGVHVVAGGVGRTNAAGAATEAILTAGPFDAVINAGVAGVLPGAGLELGSTVVASRCNYFEEGLLTPHGFADLESIGLSLGDFAGNAVPVDERLLGLLGDAFPIGPIATVATCSGTDGHAAEVVRRTGAVAEAMEGAAVVHAGRRLRVPAIEIRSISNTTGDRARQTWDLDGGLDALGAAVHRAVELIRSSGPARLG